MAKRTAKKTKKSSEFTGPTKFFLALLIGGVISTTAVAVFAKSITLYERLWYPIFEDAVVRFITPKTGDVVGGGFEFTILAVGGKGVYKVEVYEHKSIPQPPVATVAGNGSYYSGRVDLSSAMDHGYQAYYAVAYNKDGTILQSDYVHVQIDRCQSGFNCAKMNPGDLTQHITGLENNSTYSISYHAKQGSASAVSAVVTSSDGEQQWVDCANELTAYDWSSAPECTFVARGSEATFVLRVGSAGSANTDYLYFDSIAVRKLGSTQNILDNGDFDQQMNSWENSQATIVNTTPVTTIQPFAPSTIYTVTSNIEPDENQRLGFWFFKGWPRAHYSWWIKLGEYDRLPLSEDPASDYAYTGLSSDAMSWFSPLTMWLTRETNDEGSFVFTDAKLTVVSNKGTLDICLPDIDWKNPLINGITITSLIADRYGNTYYTGRYNNPDDLQPKNIAGRCTCDDGTPVGQCTTARTAKCGEDGRLVASDCRTCGCASAREQCVRQADDSYACETAFQPVDIVDEL